MSSSRPVAAAAEGPAPSPNASADSSTTSDAEWVASKYSNFRAFVHSLVPQEPKVKEWTDWLNKIPLQVFLTGADHELKGVRGASTDEKRDQEAGLVLERFALEWDFELARINPADKIRLTRYLILFASV